MNLQTIKKDIRIHAPKRAVWAVLLEDDFARVWYNEFCEGAHAQTDWQEGSKAIFADKEGNGLISRVVANKPAELLSLRFEGILKNGVEDWYSAEATAIRGGYEIYRLAERNGMTHLAIEADMDASCFDVMAAAWDRALEKIKGLAEKTETAGLFV